MKKWKVAVPAVVIAIVLFFAWFAFRPERLIVNQRVQEQFLTTEGGSPVQSLASGTFHSVVHPTEGIATIYSIGDGSRVLRFTNFRTSNGPDVHWSFWTSPTGVRQGATSFESPARIGEEDGRTQG